MPLILCAGWGLSASLRMAFVGDILLAGLAGRMMERYGYEYPFAKVAPILKGADIAFGNLECALTGNVITRNVRQGGKKLFIFKVPPRFGKALVLGGFDVVSLANNHSLNGGLSGLRETQRTLENLGILYVGTGPLVVLEKAGWRVGFLAYSDIGPRPPIASFKNLEKVLKEVGEGNKKVDILVVSLHWGREGSGRPTESQRRIAHQIINAGADIIIGHHPHVLQEIEMYKGKTIAYSLGNFVFDNPKPPFTETMILKIEIDETGRQKVEKVPCRIKSAQPSPLQ